VATFTAFEKYSEIDRNLMSSKHPKVGGDILLMKWKYGAYSDNPITCCQIRCLQICLGESEFQKNLPKLCTVDNKFNSGLIDKFVKSSLQQDQNKFTEFKALCRNEGIPFENN
jgi:hypothetical protein